ncbi:MAG: hypothetical protein E7254_04985 [Lachnospiraceae bacterium]|nr:hypothetical protein [Lachnospiraceae bacterium]
MKNIYQKDEFILSNVFGAVCIIGGLILIKTNVILPILLIALGLYYLFLIWGTKLYATKEDNRIADFFNNLSNINYYILGTFGLAIFITFFIKNMPGIVFVCKNHPWVAFAIIAIGVGIAFLIKLIIFADFNSEKDEKSATHNFGHDTIANVAHPISRKDDDDYSSDNDNFAFGDVSNEDTDEDSYDDVAENYSDNDYSYGDDSTEETDSDKSDTNYSYDNESDSDYTYEDESKTSEDESTEEISDDDFDFVGDDAQNEDSEESLPDVETTESIKQENTLEKPDNPIEKPVEDLVESSTSAAANAIRKIRQNVSSPNIYLAKKKNNTGIKKEYTDDINKGQVEIPYYLKKKLISYCPDCGAQLEGDFLICENCGGVMRQKHIDIEE